MLLCTAVISLYEKQLKEMNPHTTHITYDVKHLMQFVDGAPDLCCMV